MKIIKGQTRLVFIFKCVVIKVPIIYLIDALYVIKDEFLYHFKQIKKNGFKKHYQKLLAAKAESQRLNQERTLERFEKFGLPMSLYKRYEIQGTVALNLFAGIMANWNELTLYRQTKNSFLVPTYFSLFGLLNIQKKVDAITFWKSRDIRRYICNNSQNERQIFCSSHTFMEIENFGLDEGYLKILDYGSRQINSFLEANGKNLFNNFVKPPE